MLSKIAITGSSGLIGSKIISLAISQGTHVVRIVRSNSPSRIPSIDEGIATVCLADKPNAVRCMDGVQAVINLAGRSIADQRWTPSFKSELNSSRVDSTKQLVDFLARMDEPPETLVSASGVGYYGNTKTKCCTEADSQGKCFLAEMASRWEQAALSYRDVGRRVVISRLATVLDSKQGALPKMVNLYRWGLGGPLGNGKQIWSWVSADDAAAAFLFLASNHEANGPFNVASPSICSNNEFSETLAQVLSRPNWIRTPAVMLRLALGEMADALLLANANVSCKRIEASGFEFLDRELKSCLQRLLA